MSDTNSPLVSAEVDLRDFSFMPLDVVRLRDSGLTAKATGDEFRAAVLLWCASWHQTPAASLPNDDQELANLCGYARAMREWAKKLEAKAKYVVSGSRSDFPWHNTIRVEGNLREAISALKAKTEQGVLVGAPQLAAALEEWGLIDEYRIVIHPVLSGRGPTLFHGLSSARQLELLSTQRLQSGAQALHFRRKAG